MRIKRHRCLCTISELTQNLDGRKEDDDPCVTNVTIILFEITFRQTSLSLKHRVGWRGGGGSCKNIKIKNNTVYFLPKTGHEGILYTQLMLLTHNPLDKASS